MEILRLSGLGAIERYQIDISDFIHWEFIVKLNSKFSEIGSNKSSLIMRIGAKIELSIF